MSGILEAGFELVMGPVILPEDSFVDILRKIICTMYGIATMFGLAVPYYSWILRSRLEQWKRRADWFDSSRWNFRICHVSSHFRLHAEDENNS